jgi:class 3 adenylate cyclase
VACRVEEVTRETGDIILLTEATRAQLSGGLEFETRGSIGLKGRSEPVPIFALVESKAPIVHTSVVQRQGMPTGG